MRNIIIILSFVVVVLSAACQNADIRKKMQKDYKQSIQFFGNDLAGHFPDELPDSCSFGATVPKKDNLKMLGFEVDGMLLWKTYSSSQYKALVSKFINLSNTAYEANDSSLLLVFSYCDEIKIEGDIYRDQELPERQALAKHNVTKASSLPVPLFEIDEYKGNTISGLPEDFELYILDASPSKYIDDKYLQECNCLPEKWKHGYSKGVALSDKKQVVIYWVTVW